MTEPVDIVRAWHEALNQGDIERLVALSSSDVEVGGARGSGRGTEMLRQWFDRASIHIEPGQLYNRGETVVVEQTATWPAPESTAVTEPLSVASIFTVRHGHVTSVVRCSNLASALEAAGMAGADPVRAPMRDAPCES